MPSRLRSTVLLTLVAVFFFNTSVFGVVLSTELYIHQQIQLEKIRNKKHKDLIELRIDKNLVETRNGQFQWEKDWEFRWQGEMYDIERSFPEGNTWVFIVKHDTKEDMLRKKMDRHAQDENTKRNNKLKKNLKCGSEYFEQYDYTIPLINTEFSIPQCSVAAPAFAHYSIPDPPPWFI